MVKVKAKVVLDANSPKGRVIGVRIETDDEFINQTLGLPTVIQKTYPINATGQEIRRDFKSNIVGLVNSAKNRLKEQSLRDREFVIEV